MTPKSIKPPDPALCALVDELGTFERQLAPIRPILARVDELRATIRRAYDVAPDAASFEVTGKTYFAVVGARASANTIHIAKVIKAIGAKAFVKIATVTHKALAANVAPEVLNECVTTARTGPRTLNVFPR